MACLVFLLTNYDKPPAAGSLHVLPATVKLTSLMVLHILAYIDPGFGSIIFQAVAAGLVGLTFSMKTLRMKIVSLFKRKPKVEEQPTSKSES
jgi:energy-coupling factor transporter transmembrane protein EcfT